MRIAVVDVAAESGGALSVLRDFLSYIALINKEDNEYFVFVSKQIDIKNPHIHYILKPRVKNSWFSRLKWEWFTAVKELEKLKIDVAFSLQNTAFFSRKIKQVVYFHNVLLLETKNKYSVLKKEERLYGIYTKVIAPYTLRSLKNADIIICQTNTVSNEIKKRIPNVKTITVNPNVHIDEKYINSAKEQIKGLIYPTTPVPFKRIEGIIKCVIDNEAWFKENGLEVIITIQGNENIYASKIFKMSQGCDVFKLIGYQSQERILQLYQDHVLIINSELESFPLLFIEKAIVGGTIIAADYPYATEITKKIPNATVYKKDDVADMFEKVRWAVSFKPSYGTYQECGEDSWETVIKAIEQDVAKFN